MTTTLPPRIRGVLAPVVTPFQDDLSIARGLLLQHCRQLLQAGAGLALFGTNSEAASVSPGERMEAIEFLCAEGLPPGRMMPGTGCCAIQETVALTQAMLACGIRSVLMMPPYFYKEADDEGLFAYFSEVIDRVGSSALRLYLYHIPQYTQVAISPALIGRLLERYPATIAGLKDSSGDWNNTRTVLERYAARGFDVFSGSETFLSDVLRLGGAGCISATANVNPAGIQRVVAAWGSSTAHAAQAGANQVRQVFQARPLIAAMKSYLAHRDGEPLWHRLRPPLRALDAAGQALLAAQLQEIGFA